MEKIIKDYVFDVGNYLHHVEYGFKPLLISILCFGVLIIFCCVGILTHAIVSLFKREKEHIKPKRKKATQKRKKASASKKKKSGRGR